MGLFSVTIGVSNIEGEDFQRVRAIVDTGAHYSLFPSSILKKAGVKPYKTETMELADGSVKEYPVGRALMSYHGREEVCQVVFSDDTEPLWGPWPWKSSGWWSTQSSKNCCLAGYGEGRFRPGNDPLIPFDKLGTGLGSLSARSELNYASRTYHTLARDLSRSLMK